MERGADEGEGGERQKGQAPLPRPLLNIQETYDFRARLSTTTTTTTLLNSFIFLIHFQSFGDGGRERTRGLQLLLSLRATWPHPRHQSHRIDVACD